ncbi:hypothetical protein [Helicobacter pylori]|nr:hypothetical protein [Helicobacter pylori]
MGNIITQSVVALANERLNTNEAHLFKQNEVIQEMELESQQYKTNKLLG